ncbi:MAG: enoyl-CoA hydratase-related protein [Dehalococcoidia bacterium]
MELKHVLYEQADEIVKVTINRPEKRNAISRRVYAELDHAFARAEADDGIKVIVVAGAGDHFGGGHDLGTDEARSELDEFPRDTSSLGRLESMDRGVYWRLHDRWRNIGKPTVAMVQGYCIMGSWMLAAACDLVVAADDAVFADRSVRWGGAHHEYPTHFWELGIKKAKEHLWTGDFLDAEEAHRLGMVNRVVPRARLEEATMWLARRIALNDLYALKLSKMSINQAADIMGQSAAVRASGNFWLIGGAGGGRGDADPNRVAWSKSQNARFDEQARDGRPW